MADISEEVKAHPAALMAVIGLVLGVFYLMSKKSAASATSTTDPTGTAAAYSAGGLIYVPTTQTDYYFNSNNNNAVSNSNNTNQVNANNTSTSTSTTTVTNPAPAPVVSQPAPAPVVSQPAPAPITGTQLNTSGNGSHPVTITTPPTNTLTTGAGGNWDTATAANPKNTAIKQSDGTYMLYDQYGVPLDVQPSVAHQLGFI